MKVLGLIPARGGSKGIRRKNIRLLGGKPLLQYTIETARCATCLSRIVLSTDDEEIASVGRGCGVEVPFLRPAELALDDTPTLPVVQHALRFFEEQNVSFDAVCLLQPTHPFRRAEDIDACVDLMMQRNADSVITISPVPTEYNPYWVLIPDADERLHWACGGPDPVPRRQALPPAFHREGSIYLVRTRVVLDDESLFGTRVVGYEVEQKSRVNIDTPSDWALAEQLLRG